MTDEDFSGPGWTAEQLAELHLVKGRIWDVERRVADALDDAGRAQQALARCAPVDAAVDGDFEGDHDDMKAELDAAARHLRNALRITEAHSAQADAEVTRAKAEASAAGKESR